MQKFEAYDSNGAVVAGDKDKEVWNVWTVTHSYMHRCTD